VKQAFGLGTVPDAATTIRNGLNIYWVPNFCYEIRMLDQGQGYFGFFDDPEVAGSAILRCSARELNMYITANPINPALIARAGNRLKPIAKGVLSTDRDVIRRMRLVFDFDPRRPSGISSTAEELAQARECASAAKLWLSRELHRPEPHFVLSGNGFHLIWHIDLPANDESQGLIRAALVAADLIFSTEAVSLDPVLFNASRIIRIPGTVTRKGDNTQDRPHRSSRIISSPTVPMPIERNLLENLASLARDPRPVECFDTRPAGNFDLFKYLEFHNIRFRGPIPYGEHQKIILEHCIFNPDHSGSAAAIILRSNGSIGYKCLHNSCADKHWRDVRENWVIPTALSMQPFPRQMTNHKSVRDYLARGRSRRVSITDSQPSNPFPSSCCQNRFEASS